MKILTGCRHNAADRILKSLEYIGWIETGEARVKLTDEGKKIVEPVWNACFSRHRACDMKGP